jgi:hypothetical protein
LLLSALDSYLPKVAEHFWEPLINLEQLILSISPQVEERTSYGTPFFYYQGKMYCYLTILKGEDQVTLGICNGRFLADQSDLLTGTGKFIRHIKVLSDGPPMDKIAEVLRSSAALLELKYQMRTQS